MSSYQFVNSLASCYANQQQARPGTSPVEQQHQATTPGGDYYNPNTAAASGYPPSCYSPPQVGSHHYPQHAYATPATGGTSSHMQPSGMVDYTQLQPQRQPSHLHHGASPGAQSPGLLAPQNPAASCKYADSTSSTGVASPQDLSTTGPAPARSPALNNNPGNNNTNTGNATKTSGLTSPLSVSTSPAGKQTNASSTTSQNLSSPASSTSSTSSSERTANSNNNSKGNGSNPPQIYPWMKRVHLGQSKYLFIFLRSRLFLIVSSNEHNYNCANCALYNNKK